MKKITLNDSYEKIIPTNWKGDCTTFLGFEPCVLCVSVDDIERESLTEFDGEIFEKLTDFKKTFEKKTKVFEYNIIPLKDFVRSCNDQQFDIENSWIAYVRINENFSVYF